MMREVKTFNDTEYWGFSNSNGFLNSNGELSDEDKAEIEAGLESEGIYIPANLSTPLSDAWVDKFIKGIGLNNDSSKDDDKDTETEDSDEDLSWREKRRKKREDNNGKDDEGGISTLGWVGIGLGGLAVVGLTIYLLTRKK